VGLALVVVLETLTPAERVAFVLHDMFDLPFEEIAPIVGRSPDAARQLASRARQRVRGAASADRDVASRRDVVHAFLAAARSGDFEGLLAMLDPEVTVRADGAAVALGAAAELRGSAAVSAIFKKGRARGAQPAFINGAAGAVWAPGGKPRVVIEFTVTDGKIAAIDVIADPARLARLDIVVPGARG
jgi:RNA polymerase sigma-70 factor (ECF subfamily)